MKIALLAMSGVRAHDKKLLDLGLTLPAFVDRSKVIASLPSLGLLYLAAVTDSSHTLSYYESEDLNLETIEQDFISYDVVAISTMTAQSSEAYAIAKRLKLIGVKVVIGGLHASVCPEEALAYSDHVLIGEGENVWPKILDSIQYGKSNKIWNSNDFAKVDINQLPIPRYDLLKQDKYNRFTVQTSRGCPWRCEFCASSIMLTRGYRKRSVESIIRDIRYLQSIHINPYIEFADDNTFVDKKWGKELCKALIPLKINWFTETDITVGKDNELLTLMKQSGCKQVLIGIESPDNSSLENIELNANFKSRYFDKNERLINNIQEHGITVNGCFILGMDGQSTEIFKQVFEFVKRTNLYESQITVLTPFPGTPLYKRLKGEKRLLKDKPWESCTLFDVNFIPQNMTPDELREGLYWLTKNLYDPSFVKSRRKEFFKNIKKELPERNTCES